MPIKVWKDTAVSPDGWMHVTGLDQFGKFMDDRYPLFYSRPGVLAPKNHVPIQAGQMVTFTYDLEAFQRNKDEKGFLTLDRSEYHEFSGVLVPKGDEPFDFASLQLGVSKA